MIIPIILFNFRNIHEVRKVICVDKILSGWTDNSRKRNQHEQSDKRIFIMFSTKLRNSVTNGDLWSREKSGIWLNWCIRFFVSRVTEDNRNVSRWNSNDLFNKIGCQLERLPSMLKFRWISDDLTHDPFKERNGNAELTNTHQILKTMLDNKAFLIFRKWINDLLEPHTRETDLDTIHLETKNTSQLFLSTISVNKKENWRTPRNKIRNAT